MYIYIQILWIITYPMYHCYTEKKPTNTETMPPPPP